MTSSLVGSEMCIRDRLLMMTRSFIAIAGLSAIAFSRLAVQLAPWSRLEAVSYTHLTLPTICSV
eukprot:6234771-Prorocentrum_lima.AAC.1